MNATGKSYEPVTMPNRPAGYFVGSRGRVEGAVVGDGRDLERRDLALFGGADLDVHVVVARKTGRRQVFRARLDPLNGHLEHDRRDRRDDVTRIDRDLVAEAAADVGRHDADLVFRNAGDERHDGAMGVRRLRGQVERQPARCRIHVGDDRRTVRAARDGSAGSRCVP